jgi:micrococcal nuclease
MTRASPSAWLLAAAALIGAALLSAVDPSQAAPAAPPGDARCADPPRPARLVEGRVTSVIDGDTIRVRLQGASIERVRLLGIDAPEVQPGGKLDADAAREGQPRQAIQALGRRAAAYARDRLAGRAVGLEFDVQQTDRYGRLLAYVWMRDGILFNRLIVADGYARVMTVPPNVRYAGLFRACEREARAQGRGFWRQ